MLTNIRWAWHMAVFADKLLTYLQVSLNSIVESEAANMQTLSACSDWLLWSACVEAASRSWRSFSSPAVSNLQPSPWAARVSPLVEVVVILRPLDVDEFPVLLLLSFPTRDGKVLHVLQGLPQGLHRFRCDLDHHTVYGWKGEKNKKQKNLHWKEPDGWW